MQREQTINIVSPTIKEEAQAKKEKDGDETEDGQGGIEETRNGEEDEEEEKQEVM